MPRPRLTKNELRSERKIMVSPALWDKTRAHCLNHGRSVSSLIHELLEAHFEPGPGGVKKCGKCQESHPPTNQDK